jgi:hypothetical protein
MLMLSPIIGERIRKPARNNVPVLRGRSNKESSASTPPENCINGLKPVWHALLELWVQPFYLLLVRRRTVKMVVDNHGLTTARKRLDFSPESVLGSHCPARLALNTVVRVEENQVRLNRGANAPAANDARYLSAQP